MNKELYPIFEKDGSKWKECTKCHGIKTIDLFNQTNKVKCGLMSYCNECHKKKCQEYLDAPLPVFDHDGNLINKISKSDQ